MLKLSRFALLLAALCVLRGGVGAATPAPAAAGWDAVPATLASARAISCGPISSSSTAAEMSCRDLLIENCVFDTGDDCIAIQSGRNNDGRRRARPSENLIVRGCTMKDGHGGVVIGSEISGGVRNVFIETCRMDSPNLDRALRFKSNAQRGGILENVFMRNVQIGRVAEPVLTIDPIYEEGAKGAFPPVVRNIVLEKVTSRASPRVMWIAGFAAATIDGVKFVDCVFQGVEAAQLVSHARGISLVNTTIEPAKKTRSLNSTKAGPEK